MAGDWQPVDVRCRSDYAYAQEPRQVSFGGGEWQDVEDVLLARRLPGGVSFAVVVGGHRVELRYVETDDTWQARGWTSPPCPSPARRGSNTLRQHVVFVRV